MYVFSSADALGGLGALIDGHPDALLIDDLAAREQRAAARTVSHLLGTRLRTDVFHVAQDAVPARLAAEDGPLDRVLESLGQTGQRRPPIDPCGQRREPPPQPRVSGDRHQLSRHRPARATRSAAAVSRAAASRTDRSRRPCRTAARSRTPASRGSSSRARAMIAHQLLGVVGPADVRARIAEPLEHGHCLRGALEPGLQAAVRAPRIPCGSVSTSSGEAQHPGGDPPAIFSAARRPST